ncbi:hypothetical protein [Nitrosomonas sp.]|uniref:hypothetical protein n=1 Tax=Nitrosomonas sp. TaxID=42353 RepID=UPI0025F40AC8|nr:hypothetical protein [Nitrosomonas sp.]MCC6916394.1 hypothetical protein [Nitrosomonas sp.]
MLSIKRITDIFVIIATLGESVRVFVPNPLPRFTIEHIRQQRNISFPTATAAVF